MQPTTNNSASTGKFHDARATDIVIPIIGLGGAGKSTFVNYLLQGAGCSGKAVLVGHDQDPCTTQLQYVVIDSGCRPELKNIINRRIVLVDTPGLDGTDPARNNQITGDTVKWFKASYGDQISFSGVVYLEDISDAKHPKLAEDMVGKLHEISKDANITAEELKERTLLVTTKWSRAAQGTRHEEDFEKTENTLKGYWQPMTNAGAQMQRLQGGSEEESAWNMIKSVLEKAEKNIAISEHIAAARASRPKATSSKVWSLENARENDIVILIMGPTGAGKSSFLNSFLSFLEDPMRVTVGDDLASCTSQLDCIVFEGLTDHWKRIRGRRIVIVDTPGFNNAEVEDTVLLHRIAQWLVQSNKKLVGLGGVIYLHDITQDRPGYHEEVARHLETFSRFRSDATLDKLVLVTSKWGRALGQNFQNREDELKRRWKTVLTSARYDRLENGKEGESTWRIVRSILDKAEARVIEEARSKGLKIQTELRQRRDSLFVPTTPADGNLRVQIGNLLEAQSQLLSLEADALAGNSRAQAQLPEAERKVKRIAQDIENSKGSLSDLVAQWWMALLHFFKLM
ncbi:hypothetical protein EST38_g13144 [Candolleomyces aberdarensis]|uniref:G domain-containing protein n=1 Tax=Candolleomyces aberdarensis TaxID=2316362 RepID=A0A4Q2D1D8_9AGAR|nr:hypothetical protein EST38_g13144 [Candolleomyces aberdarensis]